MPSKFDVITVGDSKADHFLKLPASRKVSTGAGDFLHLPLGQKIPVEKFQFFCGGNALNTGVTFARLGLNTAVCSSLGRDSEGDRIVDCLRKEGIDQKFITRHANFPTPQTVILVSGGERVILGYGWQGGYILPRLFGTAWVYLTSLGQNFQPVYKAVALAKKREGFRLAYNPGTRQMLEASAEVKLMMRITDVLFVNVEEAQKILRSKSRNYKVLLKGLLSLGCNMAVVTDGPKGAAGADKGKSLFIRAYPARRVDSTGAGDAFASGFLSGFISGGMAEGLRWGSLNSAGEISQIGVHNGLLNKKLFLEKMKKAKTFVPRVL